MSKKEPDGYIIVNPSNFNRPLMEQLPSGRSIIPVYVRADIEPPEHHVYKRVWLLESPPIKVDDTTITFSDCVPVEMRFNGIEYVVVSKEVLVWIEKFKTYIECVQRDRTLPEFLGGEPPNTSEEEYLLDILKKLNLPEQPK